MPHFPAALKLRPRQAIAFLHGLFRGMSGQCQGCLVVLIALTHQRGNQDAGHLQLRCRGISAVPEGFSMALHRSLQGCHAVAQTGLVNGFSVSVFLFFQKAGSGRPGASAKAMSANSCSTLELEGRWREVGAGGCFPGRERSKASSAAHSLSRVEKSHPLRDATGAEARFSRISTVSSRLKLPESNQSSEETATGARIAIRRAERAVQAL